MGRLTAVTVSSPKRLQLGPEIAETRFPDAESADRYRYRGLRLPDHADGKYFLIPDTWTREGARLIMLRDDGATRVEFSRRCLVGSERPRRPGRPSPPRTSGAGP